MLRPWVCDPARRSRLEACERSARVRQLRLDGRAVLTFVAEGEYESDAERSVTSRWLARDVEGNGVDEVLG